MHFLSWEPSGLVVLSLLSLFSDFAILSIIGFSIQFYFFIISKKKKKKRCLVRSFVFHSGTVFEKNGIKSGRVKRYTEIHGMRYNTLIG